MQRLSIRNECGFTLVEVIISVVITGLISIAIFQVTKTTGNNLDQRVNEAALTQASLRLSNLIKSDIAASSDVIVFGKTAPSSTNQLCASKSAGTSNGVFNSSGAINDWTKYRTLVSIKMRFAVIPDSDPTKPPATPDKTDNQFRGPFSYWAGYEIKANPGTNGTFALWRTFCSDGTNALTLISALRVMDLGRIPTDGTGAILVAGAASDTTGRASLLMSTFRCQDLVCPINQSTRQVSAYSFYIPFSTDGSGSQRLFNKILSGSSASVDAKYSQIKDLARRTQQ